MPKINPIVIIARGPGSLHFQHSYETHVLADGTFQTLYPADQAEVIKSLLGGWENRDRRVEMKKNRADKPVLQSRDKIEIEKLLQAYGKAMVETKKDVDLLIFYRRTMDISYVTDPAGNIHRNGRGVEGYKWHGPHGKMHDAPDSFSVGVVACVVKRTIHTLPNGKFHVECERPSEEDLPAGSAGSQLNEFRGAPFPSSDFWSKEFKGSPARLPTVKGEGLQFMPYTEDKALFFLTMMTRLCQLAEGIRQFFGDGPGDLNLSLTDQSKLAMIGYRPTAIIEDQE